MGRKLQSDGEALAKALLTTEPVIVDEATGLMQWNDIPQLETGVNETVLLRKIVVQLWEHCYEFQQQTEFKICIVGTPGIGKTVTTPYFLRHVLKNGKTAGYQVQTYLQDSCYYVFTPTMDGSNLVDVSVDIFPEIWSPHEISSLHDPDAFLVIDPSHTERSCDTDHYFKGHLLIVSEPDSRHWGGRYFVRSTFSNPGGLEWYMPLWTLDELLALPKELKRNLTDELIVDHYREVGPVYSNVFEVDADVFEQILEKQDDSVTRQTHIEMLAFYESLPVVDKDGDQPDSSMSGIRLKGIEFDGTPCFFQRGLGVIISDRACENLSRLFITGIWDQMIYAENHSGWKIFESYCRCILVSETPCELKC